MRRRIRRGPEAWELAVGIDPLAGVPVRFDRPEDALRFLRLVAAEEGTAALRELLLAEWPGSGVHRMGDAEVLERLAAEVAAGVVRVAAAPLPAPSRIPAGGGSGASPAAAGRPPTPREMEAAARASRPPPAGPRRSAPPAAAPAAAAATPAPAAAGPAPAAAARAEAAGESPPPPLDWIEIRLVGEDDGPVPGERYLVELPDGSRREGTLDAQGAARIEGIPAGTCRVSFPELDRDAWTPL